MKYSLLLVLGLGLIFGSCQKFLEEKPTEKLTSETNITSAAGGLALATGPYRSLGKWIDGGDSWGKNMAASLEYATGKAYTQYQASILNLYESNALSGDFDYFINQWNNWYQGIRDCNLSISMLPNVTGLTAEQKTKYLGEVRTLRAFYYFNLVRYYGDVPYNTGVLTDIALASQPRSSLKTIYDKIIVPDLEYAVNQSSLSDAPSADGRITKLAARTILADVYLTMAGYPYQEVNAGSDTTKCITGNWTMTEYPVKNASAKAFLLKAKTQLDLLYGRYSLGTYDDLHNPAMNNKGEAIFQAQFLAGTWNNSIVQVSLPLASQISLNDENGTFVPSLAYHDAYSPADKRVQDRQFFFYSDTKSTKYDANEGPAAKFSMPFLYKYYDKESINNSSFKT
ncbi:MAG TPA: RagB/SusD family nutrient uptake outer membrane protein [Prolixibacteraceae bacterium]|nr:RagB/SusD family nutrient uptake outer membrane protein [Prolixibacteraceae bacterium]